MEITQITNSGEIAGFYTDANGTFHSFVAIPTVRAPEPASLLLLAAGLLGMGVFARRRKCG